MKPASNPPETIATLLDRAQQIAGWSFEELAQTFEIPCPCDLKFAKGWFGLCLEHALGASAGNQSAPDFVNLGIELKTIPISPRGIPLESTYICHAPIPFREMVWEQSHVYQKIRHVLWLPIIVLPNLKFTERRIGQAHLWQPSVKQESILKQDWNELSDYLRIGNIDALHGRLGTALHIRPKAPDSQPTVSLLNAEGSYEKTVAKGFYLRTSFTQAILSNYYTL